MLGSAGGAVRCPEGVTVSGIRGTPEGMRGTSEGIRGTSEGIILSMFVCEGMLVSPGEVTTISSP